MPIEKLEIDYQDNSLPEVVLVLVDKLNEVISIVNKISSLERLEKDLKELGEAFDKVE